MNHQFVTFRLGKALFGIDVLLVDEINRQLDIVPVAQAPGFMRGLINLRGQIVSIINLSDKINADTEGISSEKSCIVLKTSDVIEQFREAGLTNDNTILDTVGLLVGEIEDMVNIDSSEIAPPPANVGDIAGKFISGVIQLEDELLNILRINEIVVLEEV